MPNKFKNGSVSKVELDHQKALNGDDLTDFVNNKQFPHLKKFKTSVEIADTIEYKISEIFSELKTAFKAAKFREIFMWLKC